MLFQVFVKFFDMDIFSTRELPGNYFIVSFISHSI